MRLCIRVLARLSGEGNFGIQSLLAPEHYWPTLNDKSCRLRMGVYRDGLKRKGEKIEMGL